VRRGDEWLVLHRAHEGREYGGDWAWTPPSGARRPGETLEECAARELREEAGLALPLVRVDSPIDDWGLFVAEAPPDAEVVIDEEHDAFRWVPLTEAMVLCRPASVARGLAAAAAFSDADAHELDPSRTT